MWRTSKRQGSPCFTSDTPPTFPYIMSILIRGQTGPENSPTGLKKKRSAIIKASKVDWEVSNWGMQKDRILAAIGQESIHNKKAKIKNIILCDLELDQVSFIFVCLDLYNHLWQLLTLDIVRKLCFTLIWCILKDYFKLASDPSAKWMWNMDNETPYEGAKIPNTFFYYHLASCVNAWLASSHSAGADVPSSNTWRKLPSTQCNNGQCLRTSVSFCLGPLCLVTCTALLTTTWITFRALF